MAAEPPRTGRRSWGIVVVALIVFFALVVLFGMLSEREDAPVLPPEEIEGVEQQHR